MKTFREIILENIKVSTKDETIKVEPISTIIKEKRDIINPLDVSELLITNNIKIKNQVPEKTFLRLEFYKDKDIERALDLLGDYENVSDKKDYIKIDF